MKRALGIERSVDAESGASLATPMPCITNPPILETGDIHVWRFNLAGAAFVDQDSVLIESDFARSRQLVFERDQLRFLRARYCVRRLLSAYLTVSPQSIVFDTGEYGKPSIAGSFGLSFNLSHSDDAGVFAVGLTGSVSNHIGVDVELLSRAIDMRGVAKTVFSSAELATLDMLSDQELCVPFFTCWTRKEAYLKALGSGFSIEAKTITVGMDTKLARIPLNAALNATLNAKNNAETNAESDAPTVADFVEVSTIYNNEQYVVSLAAIGGYRRVTIFEYAPSYLTQSVA